MLGFFIDWNNSTLANRLKTLKENRVRRNDLMVARMTEMGLPITLEDILAESGGGQVGRPHMAMAMVKKGLVNTLQEAFVATNSGRPESYSFVAPVAYLLELLLFWTDKSRIVTYGIASVAGVIAGSAAYALAAGKFQWEGFRNAEDTGMHLLGGALMGFGGVTALGCTIGQGISGASTLAVGSFLTLVAIIAGSVAAMKWQYWRIAREV